MDVTDPKTILLAALAMLGVGVLTVLTNVVRALGDALVKKIRNEEVRAGVAVVSAEVATVVDMIEQTLRPGIEASLEDGKVDDAELAALRATALAAVKARFGADFWARFFGALGVPDANRDKWLVEQIEAQVLRHKSAP